ncbi:MULTISPECIES: ABC transporter substrate-binding protein [unclassified Pseudomonas]|uniref:ABC transporter substrate-binding protein n=1 Tax=unclassified Pseudomonas TaxID=196821 RepID=UPI00210B532D|nr:MULTISPECIES: ABC transporter substrate-binding protein [unclassified Pseudomonas]
MAPTAELRVAINLGNPVLAQRNPLTGELTGVSVALAHALAKDIGVPARLTPYDAAGKVFAALDNDEWDLAFLAIEPVRAEKIAFSTPYVSIDGTYLVRHDSPYQQASALDTQGCRIAVGQGAAYDLFLSRTLQHAQLHRSPTSSSAVEAFLEFGLEAAAGVRQPLERFAASNPGLRVLSDNFTEIRQAMAVPRRRALAAAYVQDFICRALAQGWVSKGLIESGQRDARVTPLSHGKV